MQAKNDFLIKSLDDYLDLAASMRQRHDRFISELMHSSFLIAHDERHLPITLSLNNRDFAFIFTSGEEFKKTFPDAEEPYMKIKLAALKSILKPFNLEGFILNVSSQNFYITRELLNSLDDIPADFVSPCGGYSCDELKKLRSSIDNGNLEDFIKNPKGYSELFDIISSTALFGMMVSDKDMDVLEHDGIIGTFGIDHKYDFHTHNDYVSAFTSEDKLKEIETSKFRYSSLVNFPSLVHFTINRELKGVILNPGHDDYIIPTEALLKYWGLINRTCWNDRLAASMYDLFSIED